jgi:hypothetical protein
MLSLSRFSRFNLVMITALATGLAIVLAGAWAGDPPPAKPDSSLTDRTRSAGLTKPRPVAQAEWTVDGFNRVIRIHQADTTDSTLNRVFFAAPLLALVEKPKPIAGYPSIVLDEDQQHGVTSLTFKALLFLKEFRPVGEAQVAKQFADGLSQLGIRPDEVDIRKWPIQHCLVDCRVGGKVLATAQTGSLVSVSETIDFTLDFTPEALAEFRKAASKGNVEFVFAYTFENTQVAKGEVTTEASKTVSRVVNDVLRNSITQAQRNGDQPILTKQVQDIAQTCRMSATRTVRLQHKELLPLLNEQTSLTDKLFTKQDPVKWDDLDKNDKLREEVAKVVQPLVQSWADADLIKWSKESEKENRAEVTTKANGSFGFTLPIPKVPIELKGGVDRVETDTRRDFLKDEYGVTTSRSKDGKYYVPTDVQYFKWGGGKDVVVIDESNVVYLAVGQSNNYFEDTRVPITYTAGKLRELLASADVTKPQPVPTRKEKLVEAEWALMEAQTRARLAKEKVADLGVQLKSAVADKRLREDEALPKKQAREAAQVALASKKAAMVAEMEQWKKTAFMGAGQHLPWEEVEPKYQPMIDCRARHQPLIDAAQRQLKEAQEAEELANKHVGEVTANVKDIKAQLTEAQKAVTDAENKVVEATKAVERLKAAGR